MAGKSTSSKSKQASAPAPVLVQKAIEYKDRYICPRCGRAYTEPTAFPESQSTMYAGWKFHIPMCKDCLDDMYNNYMKLYGDDSNKAIRRMCEKFDIYYSDELVETSSRSYPSLTRMAAYLKKTGTAQYKGKSYETTLNEEAKKRQTEGIGVSDTAPPVTKKMLERWGVGMFDDNDYRLLEAHYQMLHKNNPNIDNNQEIFVKSLCQLYLLMTKAMQRNDLSDYTKANTEYAKTFQQAGLKTIVEKDTSQDDSLGVTLQTISQYTPEEFYKDKELYKDWDSIGEYYERHVLRPMRNLMTGSDDRDEEYFVPEDNEDGTSEA